MQKIVLNFNIWTKKASRTNSTFGFCRHTSQNLKNQKSYFLPALDIPLAEKNVNCEPKSELKIKLLNDEKY
jgi:hypothetical protein